MAPVNRKAGVVKWKGMRNDGMAQTDRLAELERRMNTMEPTLRRIDNEFFNHDGGKGLKTIVLEHFAADDREHKLEKEFRDQRDRELKDAVDKHNRRIMAAIAFIGLVLAALQLYIDWSHRAINHGLFDSKPKITAPRTTGQVFTAHTAQDATNVPPSQRSKYGR